MASVLGFTCHSAGASGLHWEVADEADRVARDAARVVVAEQGADRYSEEVQCSFQGNSTTALLHSLGVKIKG